MQKLHLNREGKEHVFVLICTNKKNLEETINSGYQLEGRIETWTRF